MNGLSDLLGIGAIGQPFGLTALGRAQQAKNQAYQTNVTPIRPLRTPEEIQAQLEARYAEMEAEAASPAVRFPCKTCKWREKYTWDYCAQPLIMGIKGKPVSLMGDFEGSRTTALCGPEKALWEPIPTRWQRFTEWLAKVIERAEGRVIQKGTE